MIDVMCPMCGKFLHAPDESAGKVGKCPTCGETIKITPSVFSTQGSESTSAVTKRTKQRKAVSFWARLFGFTYYLTPAIIRGWWFIFLLTGIGGAVVAIVKLMLTPDLYFYEKLAGVPAALFAAFAGLAVIRVILECAIVMFRIAEDIGELRRIKEAEE